MSHRPTAERPADVVPGPLEFAGWPPCGALAAELRLGPVSVRLDRLDAAAAEAAAELGGEAVPGPRAGDPDLALEVSQSDRRAYLEVVAGGRLRLVTWPEGDAVAMATHHAALLLDAEGRRGLLVLTRQTGDELRRSLQNALRVALSVHLARRGLGLLLHAAALDVAGRAVLLVGPSGAGKTTALDRAAPCAALADDVALVTAGGEGAGWTLHETALWAEPRRRRAETAGATRSVALLLALEKGVGAAAVAPVGAAAGAALVAAHAPFLTHAAGVEPALPELALALAGAVPTARLAFGRDAALASTLEKALAAARPGHGRSEAP